MGLPALTCFFFNDTATTEIYTLSLHDALPISISLLSYLCIPAWSFIPTTRYPRSSYRGVTQPWPIRPDRKSTRLNSSHDQISYAVFCLKNKKSGSATACRRVSH